MKKTKQEKIFIIIVWIIVAVLLAALPFTLNQRPLYPPLTTSIHILSIVFWILIAISLSANNRKVKIILAITAFLTFAVRIFIN